MHSWNTIGDTHLFKDVHFSKTFKQQQINGKFFAPKTEQQFCKTAFHFVGGFTTPHTFVSIAATIAIAQQKRIKLKGFPWKAYQDVNVENVKIVNSENMFNYLVQIISQRQIYFGRELLFTV